MTHRSRSAGITLLETLCALSIASAMMLMLFQLVRQEVEIHQKLRWNFEAEETKNRIEALLRTGIRDLDRSTVPILPRIHKRGRITFTDGSPNPILSGPLLHRPLPGADAITFLKLEPRASLTVKAIAGRESRWSLLVCPRYRPTLHTSVRSFLGLSADTSVELTTDRDVELGLACRKISARASRSMLAKSSDHTDVPFVRILIPIVNARTLYVDRNKTLRYVGHRGGMNIENQPVVQRVKQFALSGRVANGWQVYGLEARYANSRSPEATHSWVATVARAPTFNLLLNRP